MEIIVVGVVVAASLTFYSAYLFGYSRGRLYQIDKLVGTISRKDAQHLTLALEKLCDFTKAVALERTPHDSMVNH